MVNKVHNLIITLYPKDYLKEHAIFEYKNKINSSIRKRK